MTIAYERLSWTQAYTYADGAQGTWGQAQFGGYEVEVDGQPAVAIPAAFMPDGNYFVRLADIMAPGNHTVRLRTVLVDGAVSEWTAPVVVRYVIRPSFPVNVVVV